jgi:hypothetical protein
LESTKTDRKQLEEDAFQVAQVGREGGRGGREGGREGRVQFERISHREGARTMREGGREGGRNCALLVTLPH